MDSDFIKNIKKDIEDFKKETQVDEVGHVLSVGDGIAEVSGMENVMYGELVEFSEDVFGMALNLEEDRVGVVILGDYSEIEEGDTAKVTGRVLEVPVGDELVGRVVDVLGRPLDGKGGIESNTHYPIEKKAPSVIERQPVEEPLHTGLVAIDSMIPIGRGQRELIIGDRQVGKTAIATDTILNQLNEPEESRPKCIYVSIGQREAKVAKMVAELEERGAMEYTTVVVAGPSEPASLSYIAPYAGCAMGEYFMDQGEDVLVIYDDLSKHAKAYRELSLLLRRPPGREAYPGDVFYLHSRLLERAAKLSDKEGGGSLTALPIIETQAGDVTAYIPTNVISITDGQIYLEKDMFNQGVRPALNVGLSVSRVGSAAQTGAMKDVAGQLRLDLAQYRELEAFAQFGSELDEETRESIERGERITEVLKQDQFSPLPFYEQVCIIYAGVEGHLDDIPTEDIQRFKKEFLEFLENQFDEIYVEVENTYELSKATESKLEDAIKEFKDIFKSTN